MERSLADRQRALGAAPAVAVTMWSLGTSLRGLADFLLQLAGTRLPICATVDLSLARALITFAHLDVSM